MGRKAIKNIEKKILGEVMKEAFKNGIAAVSTKEVARKLHISEPVIFAHFETKQNLMVKAFEEAWNALPHTVAFPETVNSDDDQAAFLKYKEKVEIALANPVKLIYIADFFNSRYYSYSEVLRVEGQYRSDISNCFARINPKIPKRDLDLLAERFIESSITSLSRIVLGHHPHDDETLLLYWSARIYGFVGALTMSGAAAPTGLKSLYKKDNV
jgi:Transcriptional regulator